MVHFLFFIFMPLEGAKRLASRCVFPEQGIINYIAHGPLLRATAVPEVASDLPIEGAARCVVWPRWAVLSVRR